MQGSEETSSVTFDIPPKRRFSKRTIVAIGLIALTAAGGLYLGFRQHSSKPTPPQEAVQQAIVLGTPTPQIFPQSQNSYSLSDCYALEQLELFPKEQLYNTSIQDLINKILDNPKIHPYPAWRLGVLRNYLEDEMGMSSETAEGMSLKDALAQPITYTDSHIDKTGTPFELICVPRDGKGYNPGDGLVSLLDSYPNFIQ